MSQLFLEFFSEEIPARMQRNAMITLQTLFQQKLADHGITCAPEEIQTWVTPQRLVLKVENLPDRQEDQREERRGPRIDTPEAALQGFLTSIHKTVEECEIREIPKGKFYFTTLERKGQLLKEVWPSIVRAIIADFTWPKSMRWAGSRQTWVRPLKSGICLFNEKTIHFNVYMGDENNPYTPCVVFGDTSFGHRFLSTKPFKVKSFQEYQASLRSHFVILDPSERHQMIFEQATHLAQEVGCTLLNDETLLEEIVGLVEWPVLYRVPLDPQFMELPREVLITALRVHQRYLILEHPEKGLAYFIIVSNTIARDEGQTIIEGNQRVLKARLSDARFFFEQDQKKTLKQYAEKLHQLVFHQELGSVVQKVHRLIDLSEYLAPSFGVDANIARQTAEILKSDLVTEMVGEFPELQGIMGKYYAKAEGYNTEIATAIGQQYYLKSQWLAQESLIPLGRLMAFVDRFDTLISFLTIGIKPTGSKDPYALRRAALVLIDLLDDQNISLNFNKAIRHVYARLQDIVKPEKCLALEVVQTEFKSFFEDRLKISWQKQGLSQDIIAAVLTVNSGDSLFLLKKKCRVLQNYFKEDSKKGLALLEGYRRGVHILRLEEAKDHKTYEGDVKINLCHEKQEQEFFSALQKLNVESQACLENHDFETFIQGLSSLGPFVNDYFEHIMINVDNEELRQNRLQILGLLRSLMEKVADFSKIKDD